MLIASKPKKIDPWRLVGSELSIMFLVATLPMFIGYWLGGANALDKIISSLIPVEFLASWGGCLTIIALILIWLNKGIYKGTDAGEKRWKFLNGIAQEVVPTIHSILRVVGGVAVTFVLLWLVFDYKTFVWNDAQQFLLLGTVSFGLACLIRWVIEKVKG